MRWCYKTVHFALKKDGLLGGTFLDDAEIEETLNDYGQSGWELVSMFETRDGVNAVFKQPLDLDSSRRSVTQQVKNVVRTDAKPEVSFRSRHRQLEDEPEDVVHTLEPEEPLPVIDSYKKRANRQQKEDGHDDSDSGIGSIRIE